MWQPLRRVEPDEVVAAAMGMQDGEELQVWVNDTYEVMARLNPQSGYWLSIKRYDRGTEIPWRHKQQMKNEICGLESEGLELFPAESRLADTANQYHLFCLPPGTTIPLGFASGAVTTDEQAVILTNDPKHKAKQEPWEEGLTTGRNENTPYVSPEEFASLSDKADDINAAT